MNFIDRKPDYKDRKPDYKDRTLEDIDRALDNTDNTLDNTDRRMNKIDLVYFINLDRREDRKYHFVGECIIENIPIDQICRASAIDGLKYEFFQYELDMFAYSKSLTNDNKDCIIKKIMGNQLSHYYLLKEIIKEKQELCIICQDDAVLIDDFVGYINNITTNLPDDAEIINIGLHKHVDLQYCVPWEFNTTGDDTDKISIQIINPYICKMKPFINPCSLAYIVTLQGAKNIIEYFDKNGFKKETDYNFNEYLLSKDIFYSSNTILATSNPKLGSDIFSI